ncbi:TonB-dependent receptor plug domain-containing protein [Cognatazoarcus halotolerans]|uniref:TonB-dependent receptor plug domain-containing protein n=1 Tax=Cognatazoarcus halotolerans TaxID=2686016 RepID=UPI001356F571|nr:TonB-dependent receptor [Cognatazoarcus halotolerans]
MKKAILGATLRAVLVAATLGCAFQAGAREVDLFELSLEELSEFRLTTMSRKTQRVGELAAAAYVVTGEEIMRSGATSIPEALRMVPGIQVARISSSRWAVTARGFNERFANKLLVLIDGRSIYTPLYSGVMWESQDVMPEDVERIEVIRGPGAALWGANAVNGVINIVTRKTSETQGDLVAVQAGTEETGSVALRHGGALDGGGHYRVYGKAQGRDASSLRDDAGAARDGQRDQRVGFRLDRPLSGGSMFTASGDAYNAHSGDEWELPILVAPYVYTRRMDQHDSGANLLGRYSWSDPDGSDSVLQAYVDQARTNLDWIWAARTDLDLDFQRRIQSGRHDLIWGLGYHWTTDHFSDNPPYVVSPSSRTRDTFSAFIHDELTLVPDRWRLILGSKFEHDSYAGANWQPNVRVLWTPTTSESWWAAVSRSVRSPNRPELQSSLDLIVQPVPGVGVPALMRLNGMESSRFTAEKALSVEMGFRQLQSARLSWDAALYMTRYSDVRSLLVGNPSCPADVILMPTPLPLGPIGGCPAGFIPNYLLLDTVATNAGRFTSRGIELSADWRVNDWWRLQGSWSNQLMTADMPADVLAAAEARRYAGSSPRYQVSLRSSMNLSGARQVDLWLRHVSRLRHGEIPAYTTLDARYAWQPWEGLVLSLVGQNLLEDRHQEFKGSLPDMLFYELERGVYARAEWRW